MRKFKLLKIFPRYDNVGKIYSFGDRNLMHPENYPEFWQEVVEKDYEILSIVLYDNYDNVHDVFNGKVNGYELDRILKNNNHHIHSVKRLSDGEIFTINDIVNNDFYPNCIIKSFYINNNNKLIVEMGKDGWQYINYVQKIKQPLFTTEDGVDIFKNDIFWNIDLKFNFKKQEFQVTNDKYDLEFLKDGSKQFSTKEKAEEYIIMNKPCLSINDLIQMNGKLRDGSQFNDQYFDNVRSLNELKNLVKQKIEQK